MKCSCMYYHNLCIIHVVCFFKSMAYAVVTFLDDGAINEVPINWLCEQGNETLCWWPLINTKNLSSLIVKRVQPDVKTWMQLPVYVEKYCGKNILLIYEPSIFSINILLYLVKY